MAEGWWTADTLGSLLAPGLAAVPGTPFPVHSAVRPWSGTYHDVEALARRLAAGLRARGAGPGDLVAFQLPNWMEAATFWAAAFLGAVIVPGPRVARSRSTCSGRTWRALRRTDVRK
jgi:non-ribosomal peptide synthetase component E (peptide arylation enzyme)